MQIYISLAPSPAVYSFFTKWSLWDGQLLTVTVPNVLYLTVAFLNVQKTVMLLDTVPTAPKFYFSVVPSVSKHISTLYFYTTSLSAIFKLLEKVL